MGQMKNIMKHAAYAFFFMAVAVFSRTGQAQDHWQCHIEDRDGDRVEVCYEPLSQYRTYDPFNSMILDTRGAIREQITINEAMICKGLPPTNSYYEEVLRPQLIAKGLIEPCERH